MLSNIKTNLILFFVIFCSCLTAEATTSLKSIPYPIQTNNEYGNIKVVKNSVKIEANKGSDLFTNTTGTQSVNKIPFIAFEPEGDFIFSAKVSGNFGGAYDGGAFVVMADQANWAKLLFERFKSGKNGIASTITKKTGDDAYHGTRNLTHQYLKIARKNNSYVFYTSNDGKNWEFIRHFSLSSNTPAKVALAAQSPLSDKQIVEFSEISFVSKTYTDYWQGK